MKKRTMMKLLLPNYDTCEVGNPRKATPTCLSLPQVLQGLLRPSCRAKERKGPWMMRKGLNGRPLLTLTLVLDELSRLTKGTTGRRNRN